MGANTMQQQQGSLQGGFRDPCRGESPSVIAVRLETLRGALADAVGLARGKTQWTSHPKEPCGSCSLRKQLSY